MKIFFCVLFDSVCVSVCESWDIFLLNAWGKKFFFVLYVSYHRNKFLAFLNSTEAQKQPAEKRLTTMIWEGDGNNISLNAFKTAVAVGTQ